MTDTNTKTNSGISRRKFITGAVGSAAVLGAVTTLMPGVAAATPAGVRAALAGTGTRAQPTAQVPTTWSQSADVVVVGYGGAGSITAITAFDNGANVLVLEKTPQVPTSSYPFGTKYPISGGGGSTMMSNAGTWQVPGSFWTEDVAHLYNGSWGSTPQSVIQAFLEVASDTDAWETKMGIKHTLSQAPASPTPGSSEDPGLGPSQWQSLGTVDHGPQFFYALDQQVLSRKIPVLFNTTATDLIQDPTTKEVLGVQALQNSSEVLNIQARKAVVLATGSCEFNEDMKKAWMRAYPVHFYGWPYATGDGIKMAQKVGADLWHTNTFFGRGTPWFPNLPSGWICTAPPGNNYILVDKHGNRYTSETGPSHAQVYRMTDIDLVADEYSRIPSFYIFDETTRKAGPFGSSIMGVGVLPPQLGGPTTAWSSDNSAEIAKGWIFKANDIPTLAAAISAAPIPAYFPGTGPNGVDTITVSIDPNVLSTTVNNYNAACAVGVDTQFGRTASTLKQIQTPPYYAIPLWPGGCNTEAGPVRNAKCQVCDPDGNAIPRLYEAGEMGGIFGFFYEGGGEMTQIIVSGRIAGNNATAETAWTS